MSGKLSKAKTSFLNLASFPALIFFQVWATPARAPEAMTALAFVMLAWCIGILWVAYRWDKPGYFDWAITVYFIAVSGFLLISPESARALISRYAATGVFVCLFSAAFFPPLLGMEPFTCHFAKKASPPESWGNPVFIRINLIMTYVWAGIFAVGAILSLYPSLMMRAIIPNVLILCFGFPFNRLFPDYYLKRLGLPSLAEQQLMSQEITDTGPSDLPRPESAREAVFRMPDFLNKEAAGDLSAIIGFVVTGPDAFNAYLHIRNGVCAIAEVPEGKPDLIIRTPGDVWLGISRGDISGQDAFMQKAYLAEGNLGLLMNLKRLFSGRISG